jgi:hypothetical protein
VKLTGCPRPKKRKGCNAADMRLASFVSRHMVATPASEVVTVNIDTISWW